MPRPHAEMDEADARIGTRLGNYILQEVIGRGGMGVVYRADHIYIHKPAAVKVLHSRHFDNPDARHRFLHEAQTASVINHPNIIGINDFGEAPDGTVFLVMAHVEGVGLDRVLRHERSLPLFRSLGILNQVTRALGAAHARGVVHRDLKPENIMLALRPGRREIVRQSQDENGNWIEVTEMEATYDFVTILDFGAAKFWDQSTSPLENAGMVIGTPAYMAPETARTGIADARSDIYSVGVIFYEMLTGTVPFDGDDAVQIMIRHVNEAVAPPRQRNSSVEITVEAERVIMRALEKNPDLRYQTMEEFNAELQSCYGSVRFRRERMAPPPGGDYEALRKPLPLGPERLKRRSTPHQVPVAGPTPAAPAVERPSAPILLTRRKSGKHDTLPYINAVEPPVPKTPEEE